MNAKRTLATSHTTLRNAIARIPGFMKDAMTALVTVKDAMELQERKND